MSRTSHKGSIGCIVAAYSEEMTQPGSALFDGWGLDCFTAPIYIDGDAWHRCDEGVTALQMITSRMRFMSSQLETPLRIVGLSTSLANARDVGEWIGASSHGLFNFPPG